MQKVFHLSRLNLGLGKRVRHTCIGCSRELLAVGGSTGSVYFYSRDSLSFLQMVECSSKELSTSPIVKVSFSPTEADLFAVARLDGVVMVYHGNFKKITRKAACLCVIQSHSKSTTGAERHVTCLVWSPDGRWLFSADDRGHVARTYIWPEMGNGTPYEDIETWPVFNGKTGILQVHVHMGLRDGAKIGNNEKKSKEELSRQRPWFISLVVSTWKRSVIIDVSDPNHPSNGKFDVVQIGSKERKAPRGACVHPQDPSHVLAARKGKRLWFADATSGQVKTTIRLKLPPKTFLFQPFSTPKALDAQHTPEWLKEHAQLRLLTPFQDKVISWGVKSGLVVIAPTMDANKASVVSYHFDTGSILDLAMPPKGFTLGVDEKSGLTKSTSAGSIGGLHALISGNMGDKDIGDDEFYILHSKSVRPEVARIKAHSLESAIGTLLNERHTHGVSASTAFITNPHQFSTSLESCVALSLYHKLKDKPLLAAIREALKTTKSSKTDSQMPQALRKAFDDVVKDIPKDIVIPELKRYLSKPKSKTPPPIVSQSKSTVHSTPKSPPTSITNRKSLASKIGLSSFDRGVSGDSVASTATNMMFPPAEIVDGAAQGLYRGPKRPVRRPSLAKRKRIRKWQDIVLPGTQVVTEAKKETTSILMRAGFGLSKKRGSRSDRKGKNGSKRASSTIIDAKNVSSSSNVKPKETEEEGKNESLSEKLESMSNGDRTSLPKPSNDEKLLKVSNNDADSVHEFTSESSGALASAIQKAVKGINRTHRQLRCWQRDCDDDDNSTFGFVGRAAPLLERWLAEFKLLALGTYVLSSTSDKQMDAAIKVATALKTASADAYRAAGELILLYIDCRCTILQMKAGSSKQQDGILKLVSQLHAFIPTRRLVLVCAEHRLDRVIESLVDAQIKKLDTEAKRFLAEMKVDSKRHKTRVRERLHELFLSSEDPYRLLLCVNAREIVRRCGLDGANILGLGYPFVSPSLARDSICDERQRGGASEVNESKNGQEIGKVELLCHYYSALMQSFRSCRNNAKLVSEWCVCSLRSNPPPSPGQLFVQRHVARVPGGGRPPPPLPLAPETPHPSRYKDQQMKRDVEAAALRFGLVRDDPAGGLLYYLIRGWQLTPCNKSGLFKESTLRVLLSVLLQPQVFAVEPDSLGKEFMRLGFYRGILLLCLRKHNYASKISEATSDSLAASAVMIAACSRDAKAFRALLYRVVGKNKRLWTFTLRLLYVIGSQEEKERNGDVGVSLGNALLELARLQGANVAIEALKDSLGGWPGIDSVLSGSDNNDSENKQKGKAIAKLVSGRRNTLKQKAANGALHLYKAMLRIQRLRQAQVVVVNELQKELERIDQGNHRSIFERLEALMNATSGQNQQQNEWASEGILRPTIPT